ncbi:MAG: isochorismatase family protein [Eggerthellaceae bacterium]
MIDPSSTALIMIDMQNGFINEASPLCIAGAKKSIPACRRVLEYARENVVPVYHVVRHMPPTAPTSSRADTTYGKTNAPSLMHAPRKSDRWNLPS